MPLQVRKILTYTEELFVEGGRQADQPLRRVAAAAVCVNPCAGRYVDDLSVLIAGGTEIGNTIAPLAVALLAPYPIQSYGKGALVGFAGEAEHAEAVLTTEFGDTMRRAAGGGKAWICHMAKRAVSGETIDIPLAHKDALTVRSHYDTMSITVPDAPMPDELVIICCFANRGRLNHRIGGHSLDRLIGEDGLR
jgi:hypothetical protein